MRKIVWMVSISLDGYFEGPDHDISWHFVNEEVHQHFNDLVRQWGGLIEGRRTYELMASYWPTADQDPNAPAAIRDFARIWRDIPKFVYSRTLDSSTLEWNTRLFREVQPDEVRQLKAQPGGDLGIGSSDLATEFLRHDLIDELRIYVHPVVVGAGTSLFPKNHKLKLRLIETHTFSNGVVLLHYAREAS